tara:strand:+ start:140 stop:334 length:195 start_codon:yes stop_codon:yes gene_type:complete
MSEDMERIINPVVTLTSEDFKNHPNDKELGAYARSEYIKQLDRTKVDPKDYEKYNWVYPGPTKM